MTPEERAVIRAAIQIERDGASVPAAFSDTVLALIYSCHECNTDTHRCPGCGVNLYHGDSACDDCTVHDAVAPVLDEPGSMGSPMVATPPPLLPEPSPEWVPTTLLYCLAGDRIRIGTDETAVRRSSSGVWYVNAADYWHPTPWKHTELRLDLEANPGFQEYPPNTPCELLCGPSRLAVLELQKAFPGTTEVPRRRNS